MCDYDGYYEGIHERVVTIRKRHVCASCHQRWPIGTRMHLFVGKTDGEFGSCYVCPVCDLARQRPDETDLHLCDGWAHDDSHREVGTDREVYNYLLYCHQNGEEPTVTGLHGALQQLADLAAL